MLRESQNAQIERCVDTTEPKVYTKILILILCVLLTGHIFYGVKDAILYFLGVN